MKTVKDLAKIVKGRDTHFNYYCAGTLYYKIELEDGSYQFPVDGGSNETGTATFDATIRAITMMRYIRKAIESEEFIKIR